MALLEMRDLSVGFAMYTSLFRRQLGYAVTNVSLHVNAGEVVGVIGASGSGKSLLAHAVMGLLPPNAVQSGEIRFDGEPLNERRLRALRGSDIALIPQALSNLDPLHWVRQDLPDAPGESFSLTDADLSKHNFELSGGQARRVLVGTAVLSDARLVIADEPTPGLSLDLAESLLADLRTMADNGRAVLVISHDVDLIAAIADRVYILNSGCLVDEVTADELRHPGDSDRYAARLWRALPQNDFDAETSC